MQKRGLSLFLIFGIALVFVSSIVSASVFSGVAESVNDFFSITGRAFGDLWDAFNFGGSSTDSSSGQVGVQAVGIVRGFSSSGYTLGSPLTVTLNVTPTNMANWTWIVNETVPAGWTITSASGGVGNVNYTSNPGVIKWFIDGNSFTSLTYTVTPVGSTGTVTFSGYYVDNITTTTSSSPLSPASSVNYHPADYPNNNSDIEDLEVLSYNSCWRKGSECTTGKVIPNDFYVLNANSIWRRGGCYVYNSSASPVPFSSRPC